MGSEYATKPSGPKITSQKRKRAGTDTLVTPSGDVDDPKAGEIEHDASPTKKKTNKSTGKQATEEKRLRRFRKSPPQSYLEKLERATTQRQGV